VRARVVPARLVPILCASSDLPEDRVRPGGVVKLEFTPACQAGGRGFESRRPRQQANRSRLTTRSGSSVGRAPV
jgi:hypothetical protein